MISIRNNTQGLCVEMLRAMFPFAQSIESPELIEEKNPDYDHIVAWVQEKTNKYLLAVPIGKEYMREWLWDLPYEYMK
jgi:hypothetical protein